MAIVVYENIQSSVNNLNSTLNSRIDILKQSMSDIDLFTHDNSITGHTFGSIKRVFNSCYFPIFVSACSVFYDIVEINKNILNKYGEALNGVDSINTDDLSSLLSLKSSLENEQKKIEHDFLGREYNPIDNSAAIAEKQKFIDIINAVNSLESSVSAFYSYVNKQLEKINSTIDTLSNIAFDTSKYEYIYGLLSASDADFSSFVSLLCYIDTDKLKMSNFIKDNNDDITLISAVRNTYLFNLRSINKDTKEFDNELSSEIISNINKTINYDSKLGKNVIFNYVDTADYAQSHGLLLLNKSTETIVNFYWSYNGTDLLYKSFYETAANTFCKLDKKTNPNLEEPWYKTIIQCTTFAYGDLMRIRNMPDGLPVDFRGNVDHNGNAGNMIASMDANKKNGVPYFDYMFFGNTDTNSINQVGGQAQPTTIENIDLACLDNYLKPGSLIIYKDEHGKRDDHGNLKTAGHVAFIDSCNICYNEDGSIDVKNSTITITEGNWGKGMKSAEQTMQCHTYTTNITEMVATSTGSPAIGIISTDAIYCQNNGNYEIIQVLIDSNNDNNVEVVNND